MHENDETQEMKAAASHLAHLTSAHIHSCVPSRPPFCSRYVAANMVCCFLPSQHCSLDLRVEPSRHTRESVGRTVCWLAPNNGICELPLWCPDIQHPLGCLTKVLASERNMNAMVLVGWPTNWRLRSQVALATLNVKASRRLISQRTRERAGLTACTLQSSNLWHEHQCGLPAIRLLKSSSLAEQGRTWSNGASPYLEQSKALGM
jgi:hypothetical protein